MIEENAASSLNKETRIPPKVTGKGQVYFVNLFLKEQGGQIRYVHDDRRAGALTNR